MKVLVSLIFVFFAFVALAQQATVSNGLTSITIDKSNFTEIPDSFFNVTEIVAKLIDEDGKTIPCTKATIVIQPKKGDAVLHYMTNQKSEFLLMTNNIALLSHLSSGTRVFFGFEPFNKVKYPKFIYRYAISIQ